nr:hypothetical protein [Haloterrigena salina]
MMPKTDRRSSTGMPSDDSQSDDPPCDESEALSPDEIFHILQTNRRRDTIAYLLDREGPIKMSDIAEHVAAKEHETTVKELTSKQRQRVYIPLYQSHLPKLDTKGIIDYNKPRGIVRPTERLEIFRPYLEAVESDPSPTQSDTDANANTDAGDGLTSQLVNDSRAMFVGASVSLLAASVSGFLVIPELTLAATIGLLFVLMTIKTNLADSAATNRSDDRRLS